MLSAKLAVCQLYLQFGLQRICMPGGELSTAMHAKLRMAGFKLKYFNSSSAKVLMDLFLAVEESAARGNEFKIEWHYASDDDNMQELGEEFAEELDKAEFAMVAF